VHRSSLTFTCYRVNGVDRRLRINNLTAVCVLLISSQLRSKCICALGSAYCNRISCDIICLRLITRVSDKILPHITLSLCRTLEASFLRSTKPLLPTLHQFLLATSPLLLPASANHPVYSSIRYRSILTSQQRLPTLSYRNQASDLEATMGK
jgi:hypothetical protein